MSNHTPGPWAVTASDSDGAMVVADNNVVIANWPPAFTAEQYPNARLIAAAPELLAALQYIVRGQELPFDHADRRCSLVAARAAIAKAEGRHE